MTRSSSLHAALRNRLAAGALALLPLCYVALTAVPAHAQTGGTPSQPRTARYCTNCATVEAVNVVEVQGENSHLGTVSGAVVGGLLGSQVGSGSGRNAAMVAGAVGGGIVGRNIERNARRGQRYELVVRYSGSGKTETLKYDNDPGFRVGDAVRVNKGVLSRDQ